MPFDSDKQTAVIKCSICTGEQIAGFKSKEDGHFTEVMLIKDTYDLEKFKRIYKITEVKKEY
ncbi:MAG: aspartate dehydrogenase [Clostridiales bacterium]|nr:aspartate dehydrogenase [Clostridiales bacterium]